MIDITKEALAIALPLARGCHQRELLAGRERWSGAGLRGKARKWSSSYARSRRGLAARLRAAGLSLREERRAHGLRVLVVVS